MTKDIEVRRLQEADWQGLCDLFQKSFGDGKGPVYWNWKYLENPAGKHLTVVALDGSEVVGCLGNIPVKMKVGSNTFLGTQNVDSVISSDHRIMTTFFQLARVSEQLKAEQKIDFTYAFTNKETYDINTQLLGFNAVCRIYNMSKVLNPTPYFREKLPIGWLAKNLGEVVKQINAKIVKRKPLVPSGLRLAEVRRFDRRFDEFWHNEAERYDIAVIRDSAYLNWRYIDTHVKYKIFSAETDEAVRGFIVLGCYKDDINTGRILDIFTQEDEAILDLLLAKSINYFIDDKMDIVTCWMSEYWPFFNILKRRGFVQRQTPHNLTVRSYERDCGYEYLADYSRWYVTMGDSDYF